MSSLKRHNLVFGENGRGKTTLCAILRSLQAGDAAHVLGRRTLGGTATPEINILMQSGGHAVFTNGAWSRTVPDIAIFDATFVSENVHSGDVVDIEHRRSLYSVIVGEQGVKLAKQIDEVDEKVRNKNTEIRDKAAALQPYAPRRSSLWNRTALSMTRLARRRRNFRQRIRPCRSRRASPSLP